MQKIRANKRLSPQARQADLIKAHREASERAQQLWREGESAHAQRTRVLYRKAFVAPASDHPSDAISRRDAADRAAMVNDPKEALEMLARAQHHGDEHLARAIGQRAYEQHKTLPARLGNKEWEPVLKAFVVDRPDADEALGELQSLADFSDRADRLRMAMRHAVPAPSEIADLNPSEQTKLLESLAETGD
ncbi:hypothetical protein BJF79_22780 [Actinomadura sp. CNU-125]|uniref:hypothetical protein n=1 Tax=Actinomadura sp. CNU-125 TaxID=1904961 RepID=UPI000959A729|nr:hypothetical protein [Actinomadura sp. CNU-125]OLT12212.1 hypothetical protein BJF79_22780 [Actinomadura sp. CNU-125]